MTNNTTNSVMRQIIDFLDNYMVKNHINTISAVEANALLAKAGLLRDSKSRPGAPLRELLRKGKLPHAYQNGSIWIIPRLTASRSVAKPAVLEQKMNKSQTKSPETLNTDLAREKFNQRRSSIC